MKTIYAGIIGLLVLFVSLASLSTSAVNEIEIGRMVYRLAQPSVEEKIVLKPGQSTWAEEECRTKECTWECTLTATSEEDLLVTTEGESEQSETVRDEIYFMFLSMVFMVIAVGLRAIGLPYVATFATLAATGTTIITIATLAAIATTTGITIATILVVTITAAAILAFMAALDADAVTAADKNKKRFYWMAGIHITLMAIMFAMTV